MQEKGKPTSLLALDTFGDLLKYLRKRARLTQRELSIQVGYTETQISRLEKNQRFPDLATVAARFIPALGLEEEADTAAQLLRLAARARGDRLQKGDDLALTQVRETTEIKQRAESTPSNLPFQLTTFIGRQGEMVDLTKLLSHDGPSRLVTLTGPGGIGKTRLALQTAIGLSHLFPDGIWLVDLTSISSSDLIPQTITSTLGITESQGQHFEESLISYLRSKQTLLVMDNCEHLIQAAARLVEKILQSCAQVQILATSREPLDISGEVNIRVPPLSFPEGPDHASPTVIGHEAVQLFIERARFVQPAFTLTDANASIVARICRQLDGIPLAIELAAARLAALDVQQIAARLDDRFNLLMSGSRTALPRHQTLRAMIDWSYDLLSEQEQLLLCRLSVFTGGWTLEAAESVGSDPAPVSSRPASIRSTGHRPLAAGDVLDLLAHLINKSLVVTERQPGVEARYRMLETVRQYAREKLALSGEEEAVQTRHLEFCLSLAERAEPELRGHRQIEWLARLGSEHENMRAALAWSLEENNAEAALRLAGALFPFWHIRGYASEGCRWQEAALAVEDPTGASVHSAWRAKALLGRGVLVYLQGDRLTAQASFEESLSIYRRLEDAAGMGHVLHRMAAIPYWQGEFATARSLYDQSLAMFRKAGDGWGIGNSLYGLARLARRQGDFQRACSLFEESVALLRRAGDKQSLTRPLEYLALEVWYLGDLARGRELLEECLSAYRALGAKSGLAHTLGWLSIMAAVRGDFAIARSLEEQALSIGRELGRKQDVAWSLGRLGEIEFRQGNLAAARAIGEESRRIFREIDDREGMGWILGILGRIAYHEGDYQQAEVLLNQSLELHEQAGDEPFLFFILLNLGELARLQGDYLQATRHFSRSLRIHRKRDAKVEVANRLEGLAKVAGSLGDPHRAAQLFGAAQSLRDQLGTPQLPVEQADYDHNVASVRAALGAEAFSAAWAAGETMTVEQAVAFALEASPP